MAKKKFQELNLKDAFLFGAALEDPETCRISLEVMLGKEIAEVTVHAEHTLFYNSDYRSIRLDIHATDENQDRYNFSQHEGAEPGRGVCRTGELPAVCGREYR